MITLGENKLESGADVLYWIERQEIAAKDFEEKNSNI